MIKLFLVVVGAFLFYLLGLPLIGFLATLILRVFLPYLLIPAMLGILLKHSLVWTDALQAILYIGVVWVTVLQLARRLVNRREGPLPWYEGHYRAALLVLSLGIPYRIGKTRSEEAEEPAPGATEPGIEIA